MSARSHRSRHGRFGVPVSESPPGTAPQPMTAVAVRQSALPAWTRHTAVALLRPAGSIHHPQYLHGGTLAAIDLGLLSVVPALWARGIDTFASCEASNGPDLDWAYCMLDRDRVHDACEVIRRHGEIQQIRPPAWQHSPWVNIEWCWTGRRTHGLPSSDI